MELYNSTGSSNAAVLTVESKRLGLGDKKEALEAEVEEEAEVAEEEEVEAVEDAEEQT